MIIRNTTERMIHTGRVGAEKSITLKPGLNHVKDKAWEVMRVQYRYLLDCGDIVEEQPEAVKVEKIQGKTAKDTKEKTVVRSTHPKDMEDQNAIEKIINETNDIKFLEEWKETEGRESIRAVLNNQLEFLKDKKAGKRKRKTK